MSLSDFIVTNEMIRFEMLHLGTEWRVTPTDQLLDDLRMLLGKQNVDLIFE